jgi:hypothetical protein
MKVKCQIVEHYESAMLLPTIWVFWGDIHTISFCWLKWSIDIDFVKKY